MGVMRLLTKTKAAWLRSTPAASNGVGMCVAGYLQDLHRAQAAEPGRSARDALSSLIGHTREHIQLLVARHASMRASLGTPALQQDHALRSGPDAHSPSAAIPSVRARSPNAAFFLGCLALPGGHDTKNASL